MKLEIATQHTLKIPDVIKPHDLPIGEDLDSYLARLCKAAQNPENFVTLDNCNHHPYHFLILDGRRTLQSLGRATNHPPIVWANQIKEAL